ncbi:myosin 4 [Saccharomyces paradoxus]|uniref:Myosin 4 n=1 Tax=Saccharomyces paradoxus TaxID=27291 RepID=A0A8B8UKX8_SACPA|nr:Myo4 [Saccharomyces paradoxus]QHS71412.1 Myo4 [Saccharomyces paradoxus]
MSFEAGTKCWYPHKEQGWIGGEVTKNEFCEGTYHLELKLEDGETVSIETDSLENDGHHPTLPVLRNPPILESTDDLTTLSYLNEPAVLHAIKKRYMDGQIYTYSGIVLIAANPFDKVDHLYSREMIQNYSSKRKDELEPHLFAIAEEAFRFMVHEKANQTVVVSGESGAGKTVSAKYIMRYFASVQESNNGEGEMEMSQIESQILATNPIMEAFGNAKTTRNDNSSRFGKYLQILFDENTTIRGSKIRTYLLEKSRLVYQPQTERNYHIFYQILEGLPKPLKQELHLSSAKDYHYTNQGGQPDIVGVDDAQEYKITTDALSLVGITHETQLGIFKILAGLLHIGNIEMKMTRNDASLSSDEPNLQIACKLLGIDAFNFAKWIVKKQIITRSEKIVTNLNYNQALIARDSVAKFIYSTLFDWLVDNINKTLYDPELDQQDHVFSFIGILDIYGFEHFEKNSFEQFCINYANEKLQQEFNQHVFKLEQEEYVKEEIEWSFIEFSDNQPCIDLIENKLGILSLLDEESRLPSGSDESWTSKLYSAFNKPPSNQVFSKPRFGQTKFIVSHYAVDVAYEVEGFIEKNRDSVSSGHLDVFKATTNQIFKQILDNEEPRTDDALQEQSTEKKITMPPRLSQKKPTLGSMFKKSLGELMAIINSTNVHYIRCIKPNSEKMSWKFDNLMVLSQLRACGVLETIRISCAGFPSRWTFDEFVQRYFVLTDYSQWSKILHNPDLPKETIVNFCQSILDATISDSAKYQIGNTKIFFKAGMLAFLEKVRTNKMNRICIIIQKKIRARYYRLQYLQTMESIKKCQNQIRSLLVRARVDRELKTRAAILLQSNIRAVCKRRYYRAAIRQIMQLQCTCKRKLILDNINRQFILMATISIQSYVRSYGHKTYYRTAKKSSILVQSTMRMQLAKRRYIVLQKEEEERNIKANYGTGLLEEAIEFKNSFIMNLEMLNDSYIRLTQLLQGDFSNISSKERQEYETIVNGYNDKISKLKTLQVEIMNALNEKNALKERKKKQSSLIHSHMQSLTHIKGSKPSRLSDEVRSIKQELAFIENVIAQDFTTTYSANKNDKVKGLGIAGQQVKPKLVNVIRRETGNPDLLELLMDLNCYTLEVTEGYLKKVNATEVNEDNVLGPIHVITTVVSSLVRNGLLIQSSKFVSKVLLTIESIAMNLPKDQTMLGGIFWLSNLSRFPAFAANQKTLYEENGSDEKDKLTLVYLNDLENETLKVFDKIYSTWLVKLMKHASTSMEISGMVLNEKLFKDPGDEKFAKLFTFLNEFDAVMCKFQVGNSMRTKIFNDTLKCLNVMLFNDLITKCPALNWKYGYEVDKNIGQLTGWFEPRIEDARSNLIQMVQGVKILQLKMGSLNEFKLLFDFWYALNPAQIQAILLKYKPANRGEAGVPNEILNYLANLVKRENLSLPGKMEIMLSTEFDSAKNHLHYDTGAIPHNCNTEGLTNVNKIIELSRKK